MSETASLLALMREHRPRFVTFTVPTEGCTCGEVLPIWRFDAHLAAIIDAHYAERERALVEAAREGGFGDGVEAGLHAGRVHQRALVQRVEAWHESSRGTPHQEFMWKVLNDVRRAALARPATEGESA